jgi:hypothetical protein
MRSRKIKVIRRSPPRNIELMSKKIKDIKNTINKLIKK